MWVIIVSAPTTYTLVKAFHRLTVLSECSYPHCLFFLDCLQSHDFRTVMARNEIKVRQIQLAQGVNGGSPSCFCNVDVGDGAQSTAVFLAAPPEQPKCHG